MRKFLVQLTLGALLLGFLCLLTETAEAGPFRRRAMYDSYGYADNCACGSSMYGTNGYGYGYGYGYPSGNYYANQGYPYGPGYSPQYGVAQASFYSPGSMPPNPQTMPWNSNTTPNVMPSREMTKIRFSDNNVEPASITIPVGTTVKWVNDTRQPQTVTSVRGDFESGDILPGKDYTATFNQPGIFEYSSRMQKDLKGTIVVR